jgi:hypothetical protein
MSSGLREGVEAVRFAPSRQIAESGNPDYRSLDAVAELTVSAAQVLKLLGSAFPDYGSKSDRQILHILPVCMGGGAKIIRNQGGISRGRVAQSLAQNPHEHVTKDQYDNRTRECRRHEAVSCHARKVQLTVMFFES